MRAVVQRVSRAAVSVDGMQIGEIGSGLAVLLGVGQDDGPGDARYMAEKIANLRIFADKSGKLNCSVTELSFEVLAVSQFTLYGDCRHGRRPSFSKAADPAPARELCELFVDDLRARGIHVATGEFQAHMKVEIINDGPVTILIDSKKNF
ncbi:MAG: D-aminoacyl-tRNA deacylase [Eubacteriales bacterium]